MITLIIYTVISCSSRTGAEFLCLAVTITAQRLEYEDDEYYYYVKAVPKATVTTSGEVMDKEN